MQRHRVAIAIAGLGFGCAAEGWTNLRLDIPPIVEETVPQSSATNVERSVAVRVRFSEPVYGEPPLLRLLGPAGEVAGSTSFVTDTELEFAPAQSLDYLASFAAVLSTSLADAGGHRLEPFEWRFETADVQFAPSIVLTTSMTEAPPADLSVDDNGAVATWHALGIGPYDVAASTFSDAEWTEPEIIDLSAGDAIFPRVTLLTNGAAIATWIQGLPVSDLYAAEYTPLLGWKTPSAIETAPGNVSGFDVASNPAGDVIITWSQHDGTRLNVHARSYSRSSGFGALETLESESTDAQAPRAAITESGDIAVAFSVYDGVRNNVWANVFNASTSSWGGAAAIESILATASPSRMESLPDGSFLLLWNLTGSNSIRSLVASRHTSGTGWTFEPVESDDATSAYDEQLAVDWNGNAYSTWRQQTTPFEVRFSSRPFGATTWSPHESVAAFASQPTIAVDSRGTVTLLWVDAEGAEPVLQSARRLDGSWQEHVLVSGPSPLIEEPVVAVTSAGDGFVLWGEDVGFGPRLTSSRLE